MKTYDVGWVYVIGHPEWKDQRVKIGMTNRSVEERARELNTNSMIPGRAYPAYAVLVRNPSNIEQAVHKALSNKRTDARRELFELSEAEAAALIHDYCNRKGIEIIDQSGTDRALMGVELERVKERAEERERLKIKREEKRARKEEKRARKQAEQEALRKKNYADTIAKIKIKEEQRNKEQEEERQRIEVERIERELQRTRDNLDYSIEAIASDKRLQYGDRLRSQAASLKNPKQENRWILYVVAFFALVELYGTIVGNAPEQRGVLLIPAVILGSFYLFIQIMDHPINREKGNANRDIVKHVDKYNKALNELKPQHEKLVAQLLEIDEHAEFKKMPDSIKLPVDYKRL